MSKKPLDDICSDIANFLLVYPEKIRFNELHRALNNFNFKISKPTLSKHLKHLLEKEIIVKNIEGKQNISYNINYNRFRELSQFKEAQLALWRYHDEIIKNLDEKTLEEKIELMHNILILNGLFILKLEFLSIYKPETMLEQSIIFMFTMRMFLPYIGIFVNDLKERGETYKSEVSEKLNQLADYYINIISKNTSSRK